jgi:hypothetical protein
LHYFAADLSSPELALAVRRWRRICARNKIKNLMRPAKPLLTSGWRLFKRFLIARVY